LKTEHPKDWLLSVEIAELLKDRNEPELMEEVLIHLEKLKETRPELTKLITNGLELIFENESVN
jgi:phenylalanine-4-hydroxylase